MNSVWVIERGEYSDYRVVGVFSSRENAEKVAESLNLLASDVVHEWPLNPGLSEINAGMQMFEVCMGMDGHVAWCEPLNRRGNDALSESVWGDETSIRGTVWATDTQHAIKILNEKRAVCLATGRTPGDE